MAGDFPPRRAGRGIVGRDQLAADFRSLGLERGRDLLVHCSLRQVGRIDGGAATLLNAILDVAGPQSTLVVPTQTTLNSPTSHLFLATTADLSAKERARFVAAMPGFDPDRTPASGMGAFAECVRTHPSAVRSSHPQVSFAAIGPRARDCTSVHDLDCHLGDRSPLAWLYAADAAVLLLGVGYSACTAFHLAEYRLPGAPPRRPYNCFTVEGETRVEYEYTDVDLDDSDFELLGLELESTAERDALPGLRSGQVGAAACKLLALRIAVDFACSWLAVRRGRTASGERLATEPSKEQDTAQMTRPSSPGSWLASFAIETAAPGADGYGGSSADWRPFPGQEDTLADYAKQIAERLDFKVEVSGIKAIRDETTRRPGIILIDPRFIADESGQSALEAAVDQLPRWVLPLLVLEQPTDPVTQKLAAQVRGILASAGALLTESSRRGAKGVSSLGEFRSVVRLLVAEAEKQYLRRRREQHHAGEVRSPSSRPSLRSPKGRDEPVLDLPYLLQYRFRRGRRPMPSAADQQPQNEGQIVTFYSFKGGTGRTMALANVAWILAANGKRVLIADWDLESPGLHKFFEPFMDAGAGDKPGIIDLVRRYAWVATDANIAPDVLYAGSEEFEASRKARGAITALIDEHIGRIKDYISQLNGEFPEPGVLHFLSPGKQADADFETSLGALDWDNFYDNLWGGLFLDALRALMKREYDYVLIDSRTGLSDVADICTVHLPDIVVDCFTLSTQGIEGAAKIAEAIRAHVDRDITILPVPMRTDRAENQKVEDGLVFATAKLKGLPAGMLEEERREYWAAVEVPYQASYGCEETLAVFGDRPGSQHSLLSSYERIVARITQGAVTTFPAQQEWRRLRTRLLFSRTPSSSSPEVILDFSPEDQLWVEWIAAVLGGAGITVRLAGEPAAGLADGSGGAKQKVVIVSDSYLSRLRDSDAAIHPDVIISVTDTPLPSRLTESDGVHVIELTGLSGSQATARLIDGLEGRRPADGDSGIELLRYPGSSRPQVLNTPPRNGNFTGRDKALRELHDELRSRPAEALCLVNIQGRGGMGKTQVALEYTHRFSSDYDVIWWMNCGLSQYVDASLVDLATKIREEFETDLPDEGGGPELVRQLLHYLSAVTDRRWLLVYDDAEDIDTIKGLLPTGGGRVLITSRNEAWDDAGASVQMHVFEREESTSHLRRRMPGITEADADKVAKILGDIPLAVAAAGALLASTGMSVPEYLDKLDQREMPELPEGDPLRDYPPAVVKAWCLSLDRLKAKSAAAARLLQICSVMASDISLDLINSQAMIDTLRDVDPAISERNMIAGLMRQIDLLALIKLDNKAQQMQVHSVVQAVVNALMSAKEKETARRNIHRLLTTARPDGDVDDPQTWSRYRLIWPHLRPSDAMSSADPAVRQLLIERVRYLRERSDLVRGRRRAEEIERAWKALLTDQPEMAELPQQLSRLQVSLANIMRDQAQFQESRAVDEAVLERQRRQFGDEHPHTLNTRSGLAADLRALGDYQAALRLDLETYKYWNDGYGDEYRGTLSAANNLALSYLLTGDFRRALSLDYDTLDRRGRVLGPTHPRTLNSGAAVARDLVEAGRYREAVTRMESVLAQCHATLGDDDRTTLNVQLLLGVALRCAGHPEQAASQINAARIGLTRGWGDDSSDALACRLSQALNMLALGQIQEGQAEAEGVLAVHEERVGPAHPYSLICSLNISTAFCLAARYPAAEIEARKAVDGLQDSLSADHPHPYTLSAKMVLASVHAFQGDFAKAEELETLVTADRERILGPRHPDTLRCRANLLLSQQKREVREASQGREAIAGELTEMLGPDHPDVIAIRSGGRLLCAIDPQPF
jgi:FxsC-like protein